MKKRSMQLYKQLEKRLEAIENNIRNEDQIEKSKREYELAIENAKKAMLELLRLEQVAFGEGISTKYSHDGK